MSDQLHPYERETIGRTNDSFLPSNDNSSVSAAN